MVISFNIPTVLCVMKEPLVVLMNSLYIAGRKYIHPISLAIVTKNQQPFEVESLP